LSLHLLWTLVSSRLGCNKPQCQRC